MTRPDLKDVETVGEAWLVVRAAFRAAGLDTADLDARLLAAKAMGIEPHQLITGGSAAIGAIQRERLMQAAWDRLGGKPVHRILGAREFYGLTLGLSPATLEPRPDTETLVDAVLPFVRTTVTLKGSCRIVDLGIGTGAIGLALLSECPEARCLGIDVSADAVVAAVENARSLGLLARYTALTGDWLSGIDDRFDLIVSNPPYIPTADLAFLSREVTDHDPLLALDGGLDGLSAYRVIAAQAADRLADGGLLALEIGIGQRDAVTGLFVARGFEFAGAIADLGGVDRVLLMKGQGGPATISSDF